MEVILSLYFSVFILWIDILSTSYEIDLRWVPQNPIDDE